MVKFGVLLWDEFDKIEDFAIGKVFEFRFVVNA